MSIIHLSNNRFIFVLFAIILTLGFVFVSQNTACAKILINEIMYDLYNTAENKDASDEGREWVEIYNDSSSPVDLSGWYFNDGQNHILMAPPEKDGQGSLLIPAFAYAILASDAKIFLEEHPNFIQTVIDTVMSLGQQKDRNYTLKILNKEKIAEEEIVYNINLGGYKNGKSLERQSDGGFKESKEIRGTPGKENPVSSIFPAAEPIQAEQNYQSGQTEQSNQFNQSNQSEQSNQQNQTDLSSQIDQSNQLNQINQSEQSVQSNKLNQSNQPNPMPPTRLLITEFLPSPKGSDEENEWIEIYNDDEEEINLKEWQIKDASGAKFIFKEEKMLKSGEYLVLERPVTKISLNNDGETLTVLNPQNKIVFQISYTGRAPEALSFARFKEGDWQWTAKPTPGKENILTEISLQDGNQTYGSNESYRQKSAKSRSKQSAELSSSETTLNLEDFEAGETQKSDSAQGKDSRFSVGTVKFLGISIGVGLVFAFLAAFFIRRIGF